MRLALAREEDGDTLAEISEIVSRITGVQLGSSQRAMVESRLRRRMTQLRLLSLEEYSEHFARNQVSEVPLLVSLLTTHHTFFFREFSQFEFLGKESLAELARAAKERGDNQIRVWSAACSRGHEVYSLAMFLEFHLKALAPALSFSILGTDICRESVDIARNGVYTRSETKEIPAHYLGNHWARGTGEISNFVKARPSLRSRCQFEVLNLIDGFSALPGHFDLIFCRNVFIYFTQEQVKKIASEMLNRLQPEGLLFLGCSETLTGTGLPVVSRGPSIYTAARKTKRPAALARVVPQPKQEPGPIRVMCVDDSPSIQALLKQILKKEHGFEIVATALNGLDASLKLADQRVDVMTLDIHMPQLSGIEYLSRHFGSAHPPVVMLTSVAREDSELASKAFSLGAIDYVEKPSLATLADRGDEIRMKLRCAVQNRDRPVDLGLDREFQSPMEISAPAEKARILLANISDRHKLKALFQELKGVQPPTFVFVEGSQGALEAYSKTLQNDLGPKFVVDTQIPKKRECNRVHLLDFSAAFDACAALNASARSIILIYGGLSQQASRKVSLYKDTMVIIEDRPQLVRSSPVLARAIDMVPATSFAYLSSEYLQKAKA